ncbi:hypothetical protein ACTXT7_015033 [Hymenolepis weldensis]
MLIQWSDSRVGPIWAKVLDMRPSVRYSSLSGPTVPYGSPSNGNPNFSSASGSNQVRPQLPYNSALFFNTMVAAAAGQKITISIEEDEDL